MSQVETTQPRDTFKAKLSIDNNAEDPLDVKVGAIVDIVSSLRLLYEQKAVVKKEYDLIRRLFCMPGREMAQLKYVLNEAGEELKECTLYGGDVIDLSGLGKVEFNADTEILSEQVDGLPVNSFILQTPRIIAVQANTRQVLAAQTVLERWECGTQSFIAGSMGYIFDSGVDTQEVNVKLYPYIGLEDPVIDNMCSDLVIAP